jgi:hypothetical protein
MSAVKISLTCFHSRKQFFYLDEGGQSTFSREEKIGKIAAGPHRKWNWDPTRIKGHPGGIPVVDIWESQWENRWDPSDILYGGMRQHME